jgi:triosephosphate isomerase (TIM)
MTAALLVANWKMNGTTAECAELARAIADGLGRNEAKNQIVIAPPFTALSRVKQVIGSSPVKLAAQNCHGQDSGAFTGEISPAMLAEIGCEFVIVGHSERRHLFAESDQAIAQKLPAAIRHRMRPILCVGETLDERQSDRTKDVIVHQIDSALKAVGGDAIEHLEIAYEPVWAIGTGLNASAEQIRDVHQHIRQRLLELYGSPRGQQIRILYGGSVKPENAEMIAGIGGVDGLLVGGASLIAPSFLSIARAFSR